MGVLSSKSKGDDKLTERDIQSQIRCALAPYATTFRINVGSGYTKDGRYFHTGDPAGFSDLFGVRHSDGKAFFIEVKKPGGKVRPEQENFIKKMNARGAIAGIARSPEDAIKLIKGEM